MFFSKNLSHACKCVFHLGMGQITVFQLSERCHVPASAVSILYKTNPFQTQEALVNFVLLKAASSRKEWRMFTHPAVLGSFIKRGTEQRAFTGYPRVPELDRREGTSPGLERFMPCLRMQSPAPRLKSGSSRKLRCIVGMGLSPFWQNLLFFSFILPREGWNGWFHLDLLSSRKELDYLGELFKLGSFSFASSFHPEIGLG